MQNKDNSKHAVSDSKKASPAKIIGRVFLRSLAVVFTAVLAVVILLVISLVHLPKKAK